jgi:hypothetical protein
MLFVDAFTSRGWAVANVFTGLWAQTVRGVALSWPVQSNGTAAVRMILFVTREVLVPVPTGAQLTLIPNPSRQPSYAKPVFPHLSNAAFIYHHSLQQDIVTLAVAALDWTRNIIRRLIYCTVWV